MRLHSHWTCFPNFVVGFRKGRGNFNGTAKELGLHIRDLSSIYCSVMTTMGYFVNKPLRILELGGKGQVEGNTSGQFASTYASWTLYNLAARPLV